MAKADTLTFSRRGKNLIGMEINFLLQIFRCYSTHVLVLFVFHSGILRIGCTAIPGLSTYFNASDAVECTGLVDLKQEHQYS